MDVNLPVIFLGTGMLIVGIVVIVKRKALADIVAEGQRSTFGKLGEKVARQSRPSGMVAAGISALVIGIVSIIAAVFFPDSF